jgi:hypothetical protein
MHQQLTKPLDALTKQIYVGLSARAHLQLLRLAIGNQFGDIRIRIVEVTEGSGTGRAYLDAERLLVPDQTMMAECALLDCAGNMSLNVGITDVEISVINRFSILKPTDIIWASFHTEHASDAFLIIDQNDAGLLVNIRCASWTNVDASRIAALLARNRICAHHQGGIGTRWRIRVVSPLVDHTIPPHILGKVILHLAPYQT